MSGHKSGKMVRVRHSSLEMSDAEVVVVKGKKQDMLTKARNKIFNFGDALRPGKGHNRTMTQATIDYFFKHCPNKDKNHVFANSSNSSSSSSNVKKSALQKQNSVGSYPIRIEVEDCDLAPINRLRPATVCGGVKISEGGDTAAALALERPRKKLSFREPEILGYASSNGNKHSYETDRGAACNGILYTAGSFDDVNLESQAMRVVRTIGQAFEVCHKLSITAPDHERDQDEQDTLTQDLLSSDRLSDITSDKPKRDLIFEGASDKMSLPPDDASFKDSYADNGKKPLPQLDILPPPPANTTNMRKSPLTSAETYASPHSDVLTSGSGGGGSLPPPGSALSAHHEIQLMREQLEQQSQQTQAALAQLQLAREQLAAEQSARLEAQARTHQLLIHNRELLDHIAALVAHLQGGDKPGQQQTPPHVTMPQQQQQHPSPGDSYTERSESATLDNNPLLQALGLNPQGLIENRAVTSHLPSSPLRTTFNPSGNMFTFPYPPAMDAASYDVQQQQQQLLLQRLQTIHNPFPAVPFYNYPPFLPSPLYGHQPLMNNNNNYALQPPPKSLPQSPLTVRHSFAPDRQVSPGRSSEPRQIIPNQHHQQQQQQHLQVAKGGQSGHQEPFIKPLSQMGTLTTTDQDGRVRVIVPVPSTSNEDNSRLLSNLRLSDDLRTLNPITRSTSEKVPNRSELMSQVQRTMWARHTTK